VAPEGIQIAVAAPAEDEERLEQFQRLMLAHGPLVLRTALRIVGRLEDAQDVSQEVFLRLYRHHERIQEHLGVQSWLYRTTVNACFDLLRKRKPAQEIDWDPPVAASQQAEQELDQRRRIVAEGLKTLPDRDRAAIVLREIEGLDTGEVADILGVTEETVRSQVSMGKAKLRAFAERYERRRR
jgi:RNA polymerase sigma-70 factor (ECF subfamily)